MWRAPTPQPPPPCAGEGEPPGRLPLPRARGRGLGGRGLLLLVALLTVGCQEVDRLATIAPRVIVPGAGPRLGAPPAGGVSPVEVTLPPEQRSTAFDWQPLGADVA